MNDLKIVKIENLQGKPKTRFCWECSRKLHGNHFARVTFSDGLTRDLHKQCAKQRKETQDADGW